jgi:hypothetical protein
VSSLPRARLAPDLCRFHAQSLPNTLLPDSRLARTLLNPHARASVIEGESWICWTRCCFGFGCGPIADLHFVRSEHDCFGVKYYERGALLTGTGLELERAGDGALQYRCGGREEREGQRCGSRLLLLWRWKRRCRLGSRGPRSRVRTTF